MDGCKIINSKPPNINDCTIKEDWKPLKLTSQIKTIISKCLQKDPSKRCTVDELLEYSSLKTPHGFKLTI